MTIFSDEGHDAHTYALGGWAITPTHWRLFGEEWKADARHHRDAQRRAVSGVPRISDDEQQPEGIL
jgi:hypothetical protein